MPCCELCFRHKASQSAGLLFLAAGSVIRALSNEQDTQDLGLNFEMLPSTYSMMPKGCMI